MKVKNTKLMGFDDKPLMMGDSETHATVARVLQQAALAPNPPNEVRSSTDIIERFEFAKAMQNIGLDDEFEISLDLYNKIRPDLARIFSVVAAGQTMQAVEKK